jgi:hypothetical protein
MRRDGSACEHADPMPASRREVTARELVALAIGACLVAVVMNWPLVLHLGTHIPQDLGDPLPESWQVAWDGHALATQPLHFFDANQFWPFKDTLAFSDALVGYAPAGLIGSGPKAAVFRYDVLFLLTYVLAFMAAYLLARELGIGIAGSTVAGAAFAFAPFRLEQDGHMQVISSGGIPLALAIALRGYRLHRAAWVVTGWVVATWQLSLGFTLGIPLGYLIGSLGVVAAIVWLRRLRPLLDRGLVVATVAGGAIFLAAGVALAQPYLRVADEHAEAKRTASQVSAFSGPPKVFLIAPPQSLVWGAATSPLREGLSNISERTLFPGLVTVGLALAGLWWRRYPRGLRIGLGVGVLAVSVLALGFREGGGLLWPYRWLYDFLPGWQAIRVSGRLVTISSLGLALLAGIGAERAAGASEVRTGARWLGPAVAGVLALAIAVEGMGLPFDPLHDRAQPRVPPAPADLSSVPAPQLHLPAERAEDNRRYLLWSTDGFPAIVNGRSSLNPTFTIRLIRHVRDFPDQRSVALLRRKGVRSVVLHTDRAGGTPWARAKDRSIAGLPLTERRLSNVIVYEIRDG